MSPSLVDLSNARRLPALAANPTEAHKHAHRKPAAASSDTARHSPPAFLSSYSWIGWWNPLHAWHPHAPSMGPFFAYKSIHDKDTLHTFLIV